MDIGIGIGTGIGVGQWCCTSVQRRQQLEPQEHSNNLQQDGPNIDQVPRLSEVPIHANTKKHGKNAYRCEYSIGRNCELGD